jgi:hypothetical protein
VNHINYEIYILKMLQIKYITTIMMLIQSGQTVWIYDYIFSVEKFLLIFEFLNSYFLKMLYLIHMYNNLDIHDCINNSQFQ